VKVLYVGAASKVFVKRLSQLVDQKFDLNLCAVYVTNKASRYFKLKSGIPHALCSNVVYKFMCLCDTNLAYIRMTKRHLETRVREHLSLANPQNSAIKDHLHACAACYPKQYSTNSYKILQKCRNEYDMKIQEALIIKKLNPKLNKKLYAKGASLLLSVF